MTDIKRYPWKGWRLWRLIITTCLQGSGAPIIDDAWTNDIDGNTYTSKAIVWPWGDKNQYNERNRRRAFVIGWKKK